MPELRDPDGEQLESGLTPEEIKALQSAGVTVRADGDDAGAGSGGAGGDTIDVDEWDTQPDTDPNSGGGGNGTDSDTDPDDTDVDPDAELAEMETRDRKEMTAEWNGLDADTDYENAGERAHERYKALQERLRMEASGIAEDIRDRDRRLGMTSPSVRANAVRKAMRNSGLKRAIVDAFREIKSRPQPEPAEMGGQLHHRNTVRHMSGDYSEQRVYQRPRKTELGDRCLGVCVDFSGSMDAMEAKKSLAGAALATEQINDDFCAVTYSGTTAKMVTAPGEGWEWDHLNSARVGGATPTPTGIEKAIEVLGTTNKREQVLVVVTDGVANKDVNGRRADDRARRQAARRVETAREQGIPVIGLGVGDGVDEDYMREMFGQDANGRDNFLMADMDRLSDALLDIYRRQLHTTPDR